MKFGELRLKWKIFIFLLGFCALLLVMLWLLQTVFLDAFYKNIRVAEIKRNAVLVAGNLQSGRLAEIIAEISESSDISIDIADIEGNSLLMPFPLQSGHFKDENLLFITQALNQRGEYYEYVGIPQAPPGNKRPPARRPPMQSLVYVKLAESKGGGQVAIVVRAVASPVDATVATLRYQLYVVSGIMLILAVILAFVIAKRISKPIEEISLSALALAKGDYDTRFAGAGFHEIAALAGTLNTAALELGKAEALRRELLANVSHDLRTPLALIYSYAEMMHDFPGEATSQQTQVILDETRRLSTLVDDVLSMSKLESDMEAQDITRFCLTQNIAETIGRMEALLENEGFQITFHRNCDAWIAADETKIDRVFYNLLINAVNYSGDNRSISVKQTVPEGSVRISVTDFGEGIPEDELAHVWDRYYKSGGSHKRAVTGSGLGLSIVKRIVEMHGGSYGVSSERNKGSTFWFEVPS